MNPLRMTFSLLLVVTAIATRHRYCESVSSAEHPDRCYQNDELYHIYVMLEAALKNNSEILYMMKQVFYPVLGPHYWLANGVYIVWIDVCTTIRDVKSCPKNANEQASNNIPVNGQFHGCWQFRWTSSPLLNLIPADQLLAFEPVFVSTVYSQIVGATSGKDLAIPLYIDSVTCMPSHTDMEQALAQLLSWSKAYIKEPGIWNQEDQGYVTRWRDYYTTEPYNNTDLKALASGIEVLFLIIFIFLNFSVLMCIKRNATKVYKMLCHRIHSNSSPIYWAAAIGIVLFNSLYLLGLFLIHIWKRYPQELFGVCPNVTCHYSSAYKRELSAFTAKVAVLCLTFTTELIIAIHAVQTTKNTEIPLSLPCRLQLLRCCKLKQTSCLQTVLLWQVFMCAQIWFGLIPLPFFILSIVSPLLSFSAISGTALVFVLVVAAIAHILHTCRVRCTSCSWMNLGCLCLDYTVFIVLLLATGYLYWLFLTGGVSLSGIKAVVLSFLPSILLSGIVWVIKKRFSSKTSLPHERQPSVSSVSTEQEELNLHNMEQGITHDNSFSDCDTKDTQ